MGYWDCPKCAAENSLDATCCWRCGYQYFAGAQSVSALVQSSGELADSLQKQSRDMLEEMKRNLADELDSSRTALDRLSGEFTGHSPRPFQRPSTQRRSAGGRSIRLREKKT